MIDDTMLPDSRGELATTLIQLRSQIVMTASLLKDLGCFLELNGHHRVRRDEVPQYRSVVTGTEGAADETSPAVQRVADALQVQSFRADVGFPLEGVLVTDKLIFRVESWLRLRIQHAEDRLQRHEPAVGQELGRAGILVELDAQQ